MRVCRAALMALFCSAAPVLAEDMEIAPFRTVNQGALVHIFGLPADSSAEVTPVGRFSGGLTMDVANEYATSSSHNEAITLDGESYRWVLSVRYGVVEGLEAGIQIPYLLYGGGFLDGFIMDWHSAFGLSQGGRDSVPKGRLLYSYEKNGTRKLRMDNAGSGIGDISLDGGLRLYDERGDGFHDRIALRTALKLPTGNSNFLRGSGSVDFSLSLCAGMNRYTEWGSLGLFGSLGGMAMTRGDVLPDQQNHLVGFGTAGLGWGPAEWISFKVQLSGHTPLYHGSSLDEISSSALMLVIGGALRVPGNYLLDIGVSEDLAVSTSPDVAFHFGLSRRF